MQNAFFLTVVGAVCVALICVWTSVAYSGGGGGGYMIVDTVHLDGARNVIMHLDATTLPLIANLAWLCGMVCAAVVNWLHYTGVTTPPYVFVRAGVCAAFQSISTPVVWMGVLVLLGAADRYRLLMVGVCGLIMVVSMLWVAHADDQFFHTPIERCSALMWIYFATRAIENTDAMCSIPHLCVIALLELLRFVVLPTIHDMSTAVGFESEDANAIYTVLCIAVEHVIFTAAMISGSVHYE